MPSIPRIPVLLSVLVLPWLGGCAGVFAPAQAPAMAAASANCEVAAVPAGAVFGVRQAMTIATYPAAPPADGSGCQRVWYGERAHPQSMQILATYYFVGGKVQRLVGRVPGGSDYECVYRDGDLDTGRSRNPAQCPKASEATPGR
jgi:hypothetical protein